MRKSTLVLTILLIAAVVLLVLSMTGILTVAGTYSGIMSSSQSVGPGQVSEPVPGKDSDGLSDLAISYIGAPGHIDDYETKWYEPSPKTYPGLYHALTRYEIINNGPDTVDKAIICMYPIDWDTGDHWGWSVLHGSLCVYEYNMASGDRRDGWFVSVWDPAFETGPPPYLVRLRYHVWEKYDVEDRQPDNNVGFADISGYEKNPPEADELWRGTLFPPDYIQDIIDFD